MVKKSIKKVTKVTKKPVKSVAKKSTKVDYYPNKMTVAVAAAAATSLTLFAVMASTSL